jgi:hypothetical protein
MNEQTLDPIDDDDAFEIEALSDEALELVAGGKSSDGPVCCSCSNCCNS